MIEGVRRTIKSELDNFLFSLQESYHKESPESNFAHYVFYQTNSKIPFTLATDIDISQIKPSRLYESPTIASVGYGLACNRKLDESLIEIWVSGLIRLSSKDAFPLDRASFFYRPTELLGIVLGVDYYYKTQPDKQNWLKQVLLEGEKKSKNDDLWTFLLKAFAANILSVEWKSSRKFLVYEMEVDELALIKWLCSVDSNFSDRFGLTEEEAEVNKLLFENCTKLSTSIDDSPHIAVLYFALKTVSEQVIQSCWKSFEIIHNNSQEAVEWLCATCDNIDTVTQHLEPCLAEGATPNLPDINSLKNLERKLPKLLSNISNIKAQIEQRTRIYSHYNTHSNQFNISQSNITMTNSHESATNETNINTENLGFVNSGGTVSNFSQNVGQNSPKQSKTLAEAAEEIQALLDQLSKTYSPSTTANNLQVATKTIEAIENNPTIRAKVANALKFGGTEALKELIDHPAVNILLASLEGWKTAE